MILAIDTSTETAGVALYRPGDGVLAEQTWRAGREQTTQLLPVVQQLMQLVHVEIGELTGIAVATGPGSYSGVRIGLSTAKTMAYTLGVRLWGVPTLDALAFQQAAVTAAHICALLPLGRGRFAWALYRTRSAKWQRLTDYANSTAPELAAAVRLVDERMPTLFCGEIGTEYARLIVEAMGNLASIAPAAAGIRRASYIAELALQRAARGEADDPATLQAIYLPARAEA